MAGSREGGSAGDAVAGATIFLIFMACLNILSKTVPSSVKLPFLAYSSSFWSYMKVGLYASTLSYLFIWAVRGRGYLVGLASCTLGTVFSMFIYGYTLTSLIGIPIGWKYSVLTLLKLKGLTAMPALIQVGVMLGLTWFTGLSGSYIGLRAEKLTDSDPVTVVVLINYALMIWLSIASTYIGLLPPLFSSH